MRNQNQIMEWIKICAHLDTATEKRKAGRVRICPGEGRGADFQICCIAALPGLRLLEFTKTFGFSRFADLEIGDTAGLETCAT